MSEEEKEALKKYCQEKYWKTKTFLLSIKMSKNTLKFSEIKANKREFHKSKEPV